MPPVSQTPADVRFGVDSYGGAVVIYVALQQGFFKNHGVNARIGTYGVGADTLNAALVGSEDFGYAFDFGSLGAMASGQLRYVAAITQSKPGFHKLALGRGVSQPSDLRGKKMGIVFGTAEHYVTVKYLEAQGIPVDSVELLSFGTALEIVAALRTHQIDAAWVFGQGVAEAKKIPDVKIVADDSVVLTRSTGYLIANRALVEQQPDVVQRVLAALIEARDWVTASDAHLKEAATFIAADLKAPVDGVLANITNSQPVVSFDQADLSLLQGMAAFRESLPGAKTIGDLRQYLALDLLRAVDPSAVSVK